MNNPDMEFWRNLGRMQILHEKIGEVLKDYANKAAHSAAKEDEKLPIDLNDIKNQTEIGLYEKWSANLEEKALDFSALAEEVNTYGPLMQEDFYETTMETLPDEGNPGYAVGQ